MPPSGRQKLRPVRSCRFDFPHGAYRVLRVTLESEKPAKLVLDGQLTRELEIGAVLTVRRSENPALFVDVGKNFFDKVDQKLRRL